MTSLLAAFGSAALLVYLYAAWLRHRGVMEAVKTQASHLQPTPSGGGLPVLAVVIAGTTLTAASLSAPANWLLASAALLTVISWIDDRRPLPPLIRLGAHALVVIACLASLPANQIILFPGSPVLADRLVAGICWLWFINLFNFMDGIDGMAGSETVAIAIGSLILITGLGLATENQSLALWIAGAAAGFLVWNWHQARIFLGDTGSIPLGLLLGWLLIQIAAADAPVAAFILPLYFTADATFTLFRRLVRGERFWQPHREHFYQQAVRRGRRHDQVVLTVVLLNILLIGCAHLSLTWPVLAVFVAVGAVSLTLADFAGVWETQPETLT